MLGFIFFFPPYDSLHLPLVLGVHKASDEVSLPLGDGKEFNPHPGMGRYPHKTGGPANYYLRTHRIICMGKGEIQLQNGLLLKGDPDLDKHPALGDVLDRALKLFILDADGAGDLHLNPPPLTLRDNQDFQDSSDQHLLIERLGENGVTSGFDTFCEGRAVFL